MSSPTPSQAVDDSLLLAVIHSSNAPLILLDESLTVVAASQSFSGAFALDSAVIVGSTVMALGDGEWNVPQLQSLLVAIARNDAVIDTYEMDLRRSGLANRRLEVTARKLAYADADETRLLVTVMDVTDARLAEKLKDDLLRRYKSRQWSGWLGRRPYCA